MSPTKRSLLSTPSQGDFYRPGFGRLLTFGGWLFLGAVLGGHPASAASEQDLEQRAEMLADLRLEVRRLEEQLDIEREEFRGRVQGLHAQRADVEVRLLREEATLETLRDAVGEAVAAQPVVEEDAELEAVVTRAISTVRQHVSQGLPYRTTDRLLALDELHTQLTEKTLPAAQIGARLWAFLEDEQRIAREVAFDRQQIELNGQQVLADIVRVGAWGMYARTPGGEFAVARSSESGWAFESLSGEAESVTVALFDQFERGVRKGAFDIAVP